MYLYYLDTSVILKRYKTEPGSENINTLFSYSSSTHRTLVTSLYTMVEIASACRRMVNRRDMSESGYERIIRAFGWESREIFWLVSVDDEILAIASGFVKKYSLRPGDAIQLSSALNIQRVIRNYGFDMRFVASDIELCNAAENENFYVLNPATNAESWRLLIE